jgi:hypothetical protein
MFRVSSSFLGVATRAVPTIRVAALKSESEFDELKDEDLLSL